MKLTLISTVLLAASTMVSAAPYLQERAVSCTVVSGVCGKSNGNGGNRACCISDDDCKDTCNSSGCGVNDGTKPQSTCPKGSSTTLTITTSTTTSATGSTTPSTCKVVANVCGKKNGNGSTGACCSSNDDCKDTCNSSGCGVSDGTKPQSTCPKGSTTTLTTTTKTNTSPTGSTTPSTCKVVANVCGKKNGNGATGACCSSDDDCKDTCNSSGCGVSDGTKPQSTCPSSPTATLPTGTGSGTATGSTTPTATTAPSTCKVVSNVCGKKNGNGATGACCSSDDDCRDTCNSSGCGVSDGTKPQSTCPKDSTATLTTTTKTNTSPTGSTTPSTCKVVSGVCGKKNGNGATGACCSSDDDCKDTCNSSGCGVSDGTKPQSTCPKGSTTTLPPATGSGTATGSTTPTATIPPSTCKVVSNVCGKKNGNGSTGACCSSNDDCKDTCNSSGCGVSDGTKPQSICPALATVL